MATINITEIIFCVSIYPNESYGPIELQTFDKVDDAKIEITDCETLILVLSNIFQVYCVVVPFTTT